MKSLVALPVALLLLLSGCAALSSKPAQEIVEQRATEQMNAFLALDYEKAFTYMTPNYQAERKIHGFGSDFAGLVDLLAFEIRRIDCEEERCTLTVSRTQKLPATVRLPGQDDFPFKTATQQTWIKVKGQWYHYKRT